MNVAVLVAATRRQYRTANYRRSVTEVEAEFRGEGSNPYMQDQNLPSYH